MKWCLFLLKYIDYSGLYVYSYFVHSGLYKRKELRLFNYLKSDSIIFKIFTDIINIDVNSFTKDEIAFTNFKP